MQENRKYFLMAILGNCLFGFSYLFSKTIMAYTQPILLLSVRFIVVFVVMTLMRPFLPYKFSVKGKRLLPLLGLGVVQPVMYFLCENYGLNLSASSFAGIMLALIPIIGLVLASIFLHEKTTLLQKCSVVAGVIGVIITSVGSSEGTTTPLGAFLLFLAALTGATSNILLRKLGENYKPFEQNYVMFGFGAVVFTIIAVILNWGNLAEAYLVPMSHTSFWISIAYLSCASSIGAFLLITKALTKLPASLVSPMNSMNTLVSILSGVLILHEVFSLRQAIGSIIIVVAAYLVTRPEKQSEK